jgi:hypothetical protein
MKNRSVECAWEEDPFSKGRRGLREQIACGEWRWQRPLPCSYAVIASRRRAWPNLRLLLRAVAHPNRPSPRMTGTTRAWSCFYTASFTTTRLSPTAEGCSCCGTLC